MFIPSVDGQVLLTFSSTDDGFVDAETGSTWNLFGLATEGPLGGATPEQVTHVDTFWFAWAGCFPDTAVVSGT